MFRAVTTCLLLGILTQTYSQNKHTLSYAEQLAILEAEMDSLSIFTLFDSLLTLETAPKSEFNVRASFTSSVTSAGRDYDLNQTGIAPGISYYHKSGLYGDLSGYWNSGTTPSYNPTVFGAGYLGTLSSKWSYSLDYERWFYNPQDASDNSLTNSLGGSLSYDFKVGYASMDYSLLFGQETAHRLIGNLTGTINLGKWWMFDRIGLYPSVNLMYGNADITQLRVTQQFLDERLTRLISGITSFAQLSDQQQRIMGFLIRRAYRNEVITEQTRNALLIDLSTAANLSPEDQAALRQIAEAGYEVSEFEDGNVFGLMNYSFTLPLSLSAGKWSFLLSYTYSIPVKLPGEFIEVDPIGYFGASISYRIPVK